MYLKHTGVTAPEWHEQKATIDAVFAVVFGLYTHVSPIVEEV